jgi:hypothetical protein
VFLALRQADGDVDGQHLEPLCLFEEIGQVRGDDGTIKVAVMQDNNNPAAFRDIGACYEGHCGTVAEFGIGFAYLVEPGKSSVITLAGLEDPAESGFWEVVQGNG